MDNKVDYIYEDDEGGLTLKSVGHFLAKSFGRMCLYTLIILVLTTIVALPIKFFYRSRPITTTQVEFTYSGISNGRDPNGATFNSDSLIDPGVLSTAVANAALDGKVPSVSALSEAMRVESVVTTEYLRLVEAANASNASDADRAALTNYHPTKYKIVLDLSSLEDDERFELTEAESKKLMSAVTAAYIEKFEEEYMPSEVVSSSVFKNDYSEIEFNTVYELYQNQLDTVQSTIEQYATRAPSFSTPNGTFASLQSDLDALQVLYVNYKSFITSNNIWRNPNDAKLELTAKVEAYGYESTELTAYKTSLETQIASIEPDTTVVEGSSPTITTKYPAIYSQLHAQLNTANARIAKITALVEECKAQLAQLDQAGSSTPEQIALATARLKGLEESTVSFVDKVNALINAYYANSLASSVRVIQPAIVTTEGVSFNILIVYLVAVLAAFVIAWIVTGVRMHMRTVEKKKKPAADAPETVEEEKEEDKKETK